MVLPARLARHLEAIAAAAEGILGAKTSDFDSARRLAGEIRRRVGLMSDAIVDALGTETAEPEAGLPGGGPVPDPGVLRIDSLPDPRCLLSAREMEVFQALAQGLSVVQIAQARCRSPKTIANHRGRILHKLGLRNVAELALLAVRTGIVSP